MAFLEVSDLQVFKDDIDPAKAAAMIDDASAMAVRVAPCIKTATDADVLAAVKAVLRSAILRWDDSGSGALVSRDEQQGAFRVAESFDTRSERSGLFRPDEVVTLQGLCPSSTRRAFTIDPTPVYAEDV